MKINAAARKSSGTSTPGSYGSSKQGTASTSKSTIGTAASSTNTSACITSSSETNGEKMNETNIPSGFDIHVNLHPPPKGSRASTPNTAKSSTRSSTRSAGLHMLLGDSSSGSSNASDDANYDDGSANSSSKNSAINFTILGLNVWKSKLKYKNYSQIWLKIYMGCCRYRMPLLMVL